MPVSVAKVSMFIAIITQNHTQHVDSSFSRFRCKWSFIFYEKISYPLDIFTCCSSTRCCIGATILDGWHPVMPCNFHSNRPHLNLWLGCVWRHHPHSSHWPWDYVRLTFPSWTDSPAQIMFLQGQAAFSGSCSGVWRVCVVEAHFQCEDRQKNIHALRAQCEVRSMHQLHFNILYIFPNTYSQSEYLRIFEWQQRSNLDVY